MSNSYSPVTQYTKVAKKGGRDYRVRTKDGISALTIKDRLVFIDEADLPLVLKHNWNLLYKKGVLVAVEYRDCFDGRITMPQVLMGRPVNNPIININGDKLDNRRCNLKFRYENFMKPEEVIPGVITFRGVRHIGGRNPYQAFLDNKVVGCYLTAESAAAAYDVAALEAYGNKARVNL